MNANDVTPLATSVSLTNPRLAFYSDQAFELIDLF